MGNFAENLNLGNRFRPPWFIYGKQQELEAFLLFCFVLFLFFPFTVQLFIHSCSVQDNFF